jgi:hypothetical protein
MMNQSKFPYGWDKAYIERVLDHYEQQTEDEAVAEDGSAFKVQRQTVMAIPKELVPEVRKLPTRY